MKTVVEKINANEPIAISPWFKRLLESMPPVKEIQLSKEQWSKLSPTVKQMVRKGKILLVSLQGA